MWVRQDHRVSVCVCVCGKNDSVHFSDVCSVTCLCGHVMFVVFMVEPLCGGMGSEGEGGARREELAGRIDGGRRLRRRLGVCIVELQ